MKEFVSRLLKCFDEKNIILHKVGFKNEYWDSSHRICGFEQKIIDQNKRKNAILQYMYDYLQKSLPKSIVLDYWEEFYPDETHKWGLAPMHYEEGYYKMVLNKVYDVI